MCLCITQQQQRHRHDNSTHGTVDALTSFDAVVSKPYYTLYVAPRSGTYLLFGGDGCQSQSTSHLSSYHSCTGCTSSILHVTSGSKSQLLPKYSESKRKCIARWWQHASVVPVWYPGNCGIFARCTEEGWLVASHVSCAHYVFISTTRSAS